MARKAQGTIIPITARAKDEAGQILIMFVLFLPVLLGMAAMSIDIGSYASERTSLQSSADAIALAAAQELPDEAAARDAAEGWAVKNGVDTDDMTVTFSGTGGNAVPKVTVEIARDHEFVFAPILGIANAEVGARAAATRASFGGGNGNIVPWGVTDETIDATSNGDILTMKYDSAGGENGNFGAISIDGNGSSEYEEAVKYGASSTICSISTAGCASAACPGATCAETASECDGAVCKPKTGNVIGGTRDGVDYRTSNTDAACDTFEETFTENGGSYYLNQECNPWIPGGPSSLRVIIIPIVDSFGNGSSDLTVLGFGLMYLEGYESGKCGGSDCEIKGRFITNAITIDGLSSDDNYHSVTSAQVIHLVE